MVTAIAVEINGFKAGSVKGVIIILPHDETKTKSNFIKCVCADWINNGRYNLKQCCHQSTTILNDNTQVKKKKK